MGRFLVDVPADDVRKLDEIAKREGKSRAAVLREAVSNYLEASARKGLKNISAYGSDMDLPWMVLNMNANFAANGRM